jgi:hypothetical protein
MPLIKIERLLPKNKLINCIINEKQPNINALRKNKVVRNLLIVLGLPSGVIDKNVKIDMKSPWACFDILIIYYILIQMEAQGENQECRV